MPAFMADLGLNESGLDRVIRASYDLLGYISFFTVGEDEYRAWSIPHDTPAVLAAGEIHSDISAGLHPRRGGPLRRSARAGNDCGLPRPWRAPLEGKEYIVRDGDVINFRQPPDQRAPGVPRDIPVRRGWES